MASIVSLMGKPLNVPFAVSLKVAFPADGNLTDDVQVALTVPCGITILAVPFIVSVVALVHFQVPLPVAVKPIA